MPTKTNSQKDFVKTALRLPPDLHTALHDAAQQAERGFNAEILYRLRSTFTGKRATKEKKQ